LLFLFLMVVALIAAKIRTECGTPFSSISPQNVALILALFGGIEAFGPEAVIFATIVSFLVGGSPFFMIPGAQMELAELGRRYSVKPRHLLITVIIGILGGVGVGGWVFLSTSYSVGGAEVRNFWAYSPKTSEYAQFTTEIGSLNAETKSRIDAEQKIAAGGSDESQDSPQDASGVIEPRHYGYMTGAVATGITAGLRQIFAGFPLHPVGFILAPTVGGRIWGSCIIAFLLRIVVLRLGGARTVRRRLQPFFIGVFLGAVIGHLVMMGYSSYLLSQGIEEVFKWKAAP